MGTRLNGGKPLADSARVQRALALGILLLSLTLAGCAFRAGFEHWPEVSHIRIVEYGRDVGGEYEEIQSIRVEYKKLFGRATRDALEELLRREAYKLGADAVVGCVFLYWSSVWDRLAQSPMYGIVGDAVGMAVRIKDSEADSRQ